MVSGPSLDPLNREAAPPEAWTPLLRFARLAARPLERFLRIEAASGILLLLSAAIALALANSPWAEAYQHFWHTQVGLRVGPFAVERSLEWLVNDGLMVIFFFVVGLEIRREIDHGELSEWRRAILPVGAALGGVVVPALLYLAVAGEPATRSGWGVPMATDIAFAVGILALLGKRVPAALRVLLLALAVIDDLAAIVVIAVFYSPGIEVYGLFAAWAGLTGVAAMQRFGIRSKLAYVPAGLVVWAGIYAAGIHPTIAGVLVGLMTPVRAWIGPEGLLSGVRRELETLTPASLQALSPHELNHALRHYDHLRREALSPAESLIELLHPWVAFAIMPLFALANAGVAVSQQPLDPAMWTVMGAVGLGLVLGKPLGIGLAVAMMIKLGIGALPAGLTARHIMVLGVVAGVGFTMALFVAQLAFGDPRLLGAAKIGVLAGSGVAAVLALLLGRWLLAPIAQATADLSADEAESSTEL